MTFSSRWWQCAALLVCLALGGCGRPEEPTPVSSASSASLQPATRTSWTAPGTAQPAGTQAGALLPSLRVAITDNTNTVVTASPMTVTLSVAGNTAPLGGTTSVTTVNGIAEFNDLYLVKTGTYRFIASALGLTSATSAAFSITAAPSHRLEFTVQPSSVAAGAAFAPVVQVSVLDPYGNLSLAPTSVVVGLGANPGGSALTGTTTVNTTSGRATFSSLRLNRPGVGYSLSATAAGVPPVISNTFDVSVGAASRFVVVSGGGQAANVGTALTFPLVIESQDAVGNIVGNVPVSWVYATGAGIVTPSTATTDPTTGRAQASVLLGTTSGPQRIEAQSTSVTTAAFTATARALAAARLVLVSGDGQTGTVQQALAAPLVVETRDVHGNPVANQVVTFAVTSGGCVVSATAPRTDAQGRASVTVTLGSVAGPGSCAVQASKAGLTDSPATFVATGSPAPAAQLTITQSPTSVEVGTVLAETRVRVTDAFGNLTDAGPLTLSLTGGSPGAVLAGTTAATLSGEATFIDLTVDRPGSAYTLVASAAGLTATSASFDILCAGGLAACGGQCLDLTSDLGNCGACGNGCSGPNATGFACVAGSCQVASCQPGRGDCDTAAANGCETNVATNPRHCGACGRSCGPGVLCVQGMCGSDDLVASVSSPSPWSYGSAPIGDSAAFVKFGASVLDAEGNTVWGGGSTPLIAFNATAAETQLVEGRLPAGSMALRPSATQAAVARFTAQASGVFRASVEFTGLVHETGTTTLSETRDKYVRFCRPYTWLCNGLAPPDTRFQFRPGSNCDVVYPQATGQWSCGPVDTTVRETQTTTVSTPIRATPNIQVRVNGQSAWGRSALNDRSSSSAHAFAWDTSWSYTYPSHPRSYPSSWSSDRQRGALTLALTAGDVVDFVVEPGTGADANDVTGLSARFELACASGFSDCDGDPSNGCEAELALRGGSCERVSVAHSTAGFETNGNAYDSDGSSDGRYVAFLDDATNLAPNLAPNAGFRQVYLRDLVAGSTSLVSRGPAGDAANGYQSQLSMSPDGRWLVFLSDASNLGGSGPRTSHAYVFDRVSNTTEQVDLSVTGEAANQAVHSISLSDDGRFVAFTSNATNLDPAHPASGTVSDVFLKDRASGAVTRLLGLGGISPEFSINRCVLSGDGSTVLVESAASNLVPDDTNARYDVFAVDVSRGAVERLSVNGSTQGDGHSHLTPAPVSRDGRLVTFSSTATTLGGGPAGYVFLVDRASGVLTNLGRGSGSALSRDGRWLAMTTPDALTADDLDPGNDVFLMDLTSRAWTLISSRVAEGISNHALWARVVGRHVLWAGTGRAFSTNVGSPGYRPFLSALIRPAEVDTTRFPSTEAAGATFSIASMLFDERGHGVLASGVPVTLDLASGPAGVTFGPATVSTTRGACAFSLSLPLAGRYTFSLSAPGYASRTFGPITITPGAATNLVLLSGDAQTAPVTSALAPFVVRVTDAFGNPVAGRQVGWSVVENTGSITTASATTDSSGEATATATLSSAAGANSFLATSGTLTLAFSALGTPGAAERIAWAVQPPTTVSAGVVMTPAPVVVLLDAFGNLVDNVSESVSVRWLRADPDLDHRVPQLQGNTTVPYSGGRAVMSALFANEACLESMRASTASLEAISDPVEVTAGAVSPLTSGLWANPWAAEANGADSITISVLAKDQFSNRVGGALAAVEVTGSGNHLGSFALTNLMGGSFAMLTSTRAESKTLTATINGVALPAVQVSFTSLSTCALGERDCNGDSTDGCETDLSTPSNCGSCGNVCAFVNASAACTASLCTLSNCDVGFSDCDSDPSNGCETSGACTTPCSATAPSGVPEVVAANRNHPFRIVSDGTSFYWTEYFGGSVNTCAVDGGCQGNPTLLAQGSMAYDVAVEGTNLFWTDVGANRVSRCTTSCANDSTLEFNAGLGGPTSIVANATHFFWNDSNRAIYSCPVTGCGPTPNTFVSGNYGLAYMAIDATSVYFMSSQLLRCPLSGCVNNTPEVLSTDGVSGYGGIATDGVKVYYSTYTSGEVRSCDVGGCGTGTVVASTPGGAPVALAVDACNVYWLDQVSHALYGCPKTGCGTSPWVLASGMIDPVGIAVDREYIYWTDRGVTTTNGSVMRLHK